MSMLFDLLSRHLSRAWKPAKAPHVRRNFRCRCGRPVFFRNTACLGCQRALGFDPQRLVVASLEALDDGRWRIDGGEAATRWRRCANFEPAGCNWLVDDAEADAHEGLCRACRLNRTIPDLGDTVHVQWWRGIEVAKRRLVSQLLGLGLPVRSRVTEDPEHGLMFDFLRAEPGGEPVLTGHANGLVTLNVEEADDARREQIRHALREPYRTLLGHLRHEVGHYYWDRLVRDGRRLEPFGARFGDERADYGQALQRHYDAGPAPDWPQRCVSAYASSHPWEDWAETWAHYLHMVDTLETALSFGLEADDVDVDVEPFGPDALDDPRDRGARRFLRFVNAWVELTTMLNEMSRSMGQPDFYPFVLSRPAVAKLHFVHRVVGAASR